MARIGFMLSFPKEYKGGINYLKNLFFALNLREDNKPDIYLFVPSDIEDEYLAMFGTVAKVIKVKSLIRWHPYWLIDKLAGRFLRYMPCALFHLKKYKIDVVSHSNFYSVGHKMGVINWIPDFQYLHYSHLWTTKEIAYVTKLYGNLVKFSDKIVLSSNNALNDFKGVYPHQLSKAEVVHFVCQPQQDLALLATANRKQVEKYIGADIPYFYLPNQFWKHKNHLTTFRACKILKDKGYVFQLLCSGYMKDFLENSDHIDQLVRYVKENNLDEYIKFLGLIPYSDVFSLTINANALINPSFFEGWSSTVEEAKTVGTLTILSDILVHREQNPINALYFNPEDASQLAQLMEDVLLGNTVVEKPGGAFLQDQLLSRTLEFGKRYMDIVKELTRIKA